ncbi:MAG TPA: hypothetical protein VI818_01115 [Candidatus Thermoplasmatota archaeon]|nr:hypothetical protein [Candidatus Thermoplasmatota archaeon]
MTTPTDPAKPEAAPADAPQPPVEPKPDDKRVVDDPVARDTNVDPPAPGASGMRRFMTKGKIITFASVAAVLLLLGGAFLYLLQPVSGVEYEDPVDAESRSLNTALYATLLAAGINDPFVDVNSNRAYVAYVLPNTTAPTDANITIYQRFVIGAAADAAPDSTKIFALLYAEKDPRTLWSVDMSDVRAYMRGELDAAGLDAKITKTNF